MAKRDDTPPAAAGVWSETKTTPKPLTTPNTSAVEDTAFAEPAAFDHWPPADRFVSVLQERSAQLPSPASAASALGAHSVSQECEGLVLGVFRRVTKLAVPACSHASHLRKTVKKYRYTHRDEKDIFNFALVTDSDREACVEACVSFSTPLLSTSRFTLSSSVVAATRRRQKPR